MREAVAIALLSLSCDRPPAALVPAGVASVHRTAVTAAPSSAPPAAAPDDTPAPAPLLLVTEPNVLASLESRGLALARFFGASTGDDGATLARTPGYAPVARSIEREAAELARRDPSAGVRVDRYSHRLFDVRWLRAPSTRFELVGIVNRFDRAPFAAGSCGETRLVYRLSYATQVGDNPVSSRLPMTLALELVVPDDGASCRTTVARWQPPRTLEGEALADFLVGPRGPLSPALLDAGRRGPHRIVTNTQLVRWPSTVRPDLGGHAEYLLSSFQPTPEGGYAPALLENTPDLVRLRRDPSLVKELARALSTKAAREAIDDGTFLLEDRFLAKRAVSVTPRGLSRGQNRPFSALLGERDFVGMEPLAGKHVRSLEGLLRRLDALSCPGCHEARSVAGFHLLGDDPTDAPAGTALATGASPHLIGDLDRRAKVAAAALAGEQPDFAQGFPERSSSGGYGAHCGLDGEPTFREWGCDPGLVCRPYDAPKGEHVGQCLPGAASRAGDPCEVGPLARNTDGTRDRVASVVRESCAGSAVCNRNAVGFPGGMCTESCDALSPGSACGKIAILEPFNACVARGEPFVTCLASHARPAGLRACGRETPCRDDYVCARADTGETGAGQPSPGGRSPASKTARVDPGGACIPPYFLFQLRVDGHP